MFFNKCGRVGSELAQGRCEKKLGHWHIPEEHRFFLFAWAYGYSFFGSKIYFPFLFFFKWEGDEHDEHPAILIWKCRVPWLAGEVHWWFGTFFMTFHTLGMSSSQLTFIFFRGVGQPPTRVLLTIINHILTIINHILTIEIVCFRMLSYAFIFFRGIRQPPSSSIFTWAIKNTLVNWLL